MTWYVLSLLAALAAVIALIFAWKVSLRYWKIGFGLALGFRRLDGTVWVTSRLLRYPAHNAGITHPCQVMSVNGKTMVFEKEKDFDTWFKSSKPRLWKEETWVLQAARGFREVKMMPTLVTTNIPVRWDPNEQTTSTEPVADYNPDPRMQSFPVFCRKTGDLIRMGRRLKQSPMAYK